MSDSYASQEERNNPGMFKEAVCIDAMRVYDSCSDKEYSSYIINQNLKLFSWPVAKCRTYDIFKFVKAGSVIRSYEALVTKQKIF